MWLLQVFLNRLIWLWAQPLFYITPSLCRTSQVAEFPLSLEISTFAQKKKRKKKNKKTRLVYVTQICSTHCSWSPFLTRDTAACICCRIFLSCFDWLKRGNFPSYAFLPISATGQWKPTFISWTSTLAASVCPARVQVLWLTGASRPPPVIHTLVLYVILNSHYH